MKYVITVAFILFALPVLAQQPFPNEFKQRGIQECMQQPLQVPVKFTNEQRFAFCTCLFDYYQTTFTFDDMQRIDQLARTAPQNIPQPVIKKIERGTLTCAQQYIFNNR